jgi:predicted dienelactone hydrolase
VRLAMIGHSLGGATAASLMHVDPRIDAGVNLDGSVRGPVVAAGLDRPFMLMLGPGRIRLDSSFRRFSRSQRGPLARIVFRDIEHAGFTDLMALVPQLAQQVPGIRKAVPVGKAAPNRAVAAQRAYVLAFLDTYLRGRPSPLFGVGASPLGGAEVVVRSPRG